MAIPIVNGEDILASDFTGTRYLAIAPSDLVPYESAQGWQISDILATSVDTGTLVGYIPIHLPHGCTINSVKVFWYRNDASAAGVCSMQRNDGGGGSGIMASADSDSTTGYHTVTDDSISNPVVDNANYNYNLGISLNPNDAASDVGFAGAVITFTVNNPRP